MTKTSSKTDWTPTDPLLTMDILSNPIMVADANMVIRYVNPAAVAMFRAIEMDIKKDLPHFSASEVLGKSIDYFHKNPAYQRGIMDDIKSPHDGKFKVGGRDLAFRATPTFDEARELVSVYVEWQDHSAAIANKTQIDNLMAGVREMAVKHEEGMIYDRVDLTGLSDEFADVATLVNAMVEGHINTKKKIVACMQAFADGDFDYPVETFEGDRVFLNEAVEAARKSLKDVVGEIEDMSNAIVEGRLDHPVRVKDFKGGYRSLVEAISRAYDSLNVTIGEVRDQVTQIVTAIGEVNSSASNLSTASQMQSSAVEQISSSVEETDAMVQANMTATESMLAVVQSADEISTDGSDIVSEMGKAMDAIRTSSGEISKIIKVIDEIAFQTNLLSLNAAVEAARAGEHGRGFAVVAQEVRNLAQRSAKAAKETGDLIEVATANVGRGVKGAEASEDAFNKISAEVKRIEDSARQIATSSREQATGVSQISEAVSQLSKSGMEVSAQSEELATAATQMESSTGSVRDSLARFRVRPRTQDSSKSDILAGMSSADRDAIMQMIMQSKSMNGFAPAAAQMNGKLNGHANGADHDKRGYGAF